MNVWDILILCLLAGALILALRSHRRARRNGSSCCSVGCEGCSRCASAGNGSGQK